MKGVQHQQFSGGFLSQYYCTDPTLLNFIVQIETSAFNVLWLQTGNNVSKEYL